MKRLTPIQRRRLQKRLGDSGDEGEEQVRGRLTHSTSVGTLPRTNIRKVAIGPSKSESRHHTGGADAAPPRNAIHTGNHGTKSK